MFPTMTAYCLIHGSGQGPEGWKLLVHELEQRGHSVLTPAFQISRTDEGLAWHAETIVQALDRSGLTELMLSASHIPPAECTFQSLPNAGRRGAWYFWQRLFRARA